MNSLIKWVTCLAFSVTVVTFSPLSMAEPQPKSPSWLKRPAAAPPKTPSQREQNLGWKFSGATLILAALVGASLYARRKFRGNPLQGTAHLGLHSKLRLANKSELVIASVGPRLLLLGVTEESVTPLSWLDSSDLEMKPEATSGEPRAESNLLDQKPFSRVLRDMVGRGELSSARRPPSNQQLSPAEQLAQEAQGERVNVHSLRHARSRSQPNDPAQMEEQALELVQHLRSRLG